MLALRGSALVPRVPVQGRQIPAKANSGRSSASANQCGTLGWRSVYSQNEVAGTPLSYRVPLHSGYREHPKRTCHAGGHVVRYG